MRTSYPSRLLSSLAALASLAAAAHAQLLGTSMTGSLKLNGGSTNYFDPGNGQVPAGFLNTTQGMTVTVAEPAIEFGYADSSGSKSVNAAASLITLTSTESASNVAGPFVVDLTDAALLGATITQATNTFPGLTFSLVGNKLTINAPSATSKGTRTATFDVKAAPVPEPATCAALAAGALALLRRRRR